MRRDIDFLDPTRYTRLERTMHHAQQVRRIDPELAALMVANEGKARKPKGKQKRVYSETIVNRAGQEHAAGIDYANPDIRALNPDLVKQKERADE